MAKTGETRRGGCDDIKERLSDIPVGERMDVTFIVSRIAFNYRRLHVTVLHHEAGSPKRDDVNQGGRFAPHNCGPDHIYSRETFSRSCSSSFMDVH